MSGARPSLLGRIAAIDDGTIVRAVFFALLAGAASVVYVDYREMMDQTATLPDGTLVPQLPAFPLDGPELPSGPAVTADPAVLRAPLTVTLGSGGVLELTGTIDVGAAERVKSEIDARGEYIKTVALNSPGGSVTDALAIGTAIRDGGFGTSVADGAMCASSCPLIFASGVTRTAGAHAAIGVHQIYAATIAGQPLQGARATGIAMSDTQSTTATITRHLTTMGVDPALWLHALETPPNQLYYFSPEELATYRMVTPAPVTAVRTLTQVTAEPPPAT